MINVKEVKKEFISELLKKNIKKVLDLGCGEFLMSKNFLKKGSYVKGIDVKQSSDIPNGAVFVNGNVINEDFEKDYDLIISSLMLHFFRKRDDALKVINKMKDSTVNGGYNFLILISDKDPKHDNERFFPSLNEASELYSDWKLIKSMEGETDFEEHDNLARHKHGLVFLIFQKGYGKKAEKGKKK